MVHFIPGDGLLGTGVTGAWIKTFVAEGTPCPSPCWGKTLAIGIAWVGTTFPVLCATIVGWTFTKIN